MAVEWFGERISAVVRQAAMVGVVAGTEAVRTRAIQKIMSPPNTGVVYRRGGVSHQASAPGEAPASDLGTLAQSATTEYDTERLRGSVVFRTAYAAALEFGAFRDTAEGLWELLPRPYARSSLLELSKKIQDDIREGINKALAAEKRKQR